MLKCLISLLVERLTKFYKEKQTTFKKKVARLFLCALFDPVGEIASMSTPVVFELVKNVNAKVVIPHHYCYSATDDLYGSTTIDDFMGRITDGFTIEESELYILNNNPVEKTVVHLIPTFELL